jgi:hypothetical protein
MTLLNAILILVTSFCASIIFCKIKLKRDYKRKLENYYRDVCKEENKCYKPIK